MLKSISIINSYYFPNIIGGAEISTQILSESLSTKIGVDIICTGPHKKGVKLDKINNISVWRLPCNNIYWPGYKRARSGLKKAIWHTKNIYNKDQYTELKKLLIKLNPSIIHTQNLAGISVAAWKVSKEMNIPLVHTLRDYSLIKPINQKLYCYIFRQLSRRFSQSVDHVIGISDFVLNKHLRYDLFPNAKKDVIPNVVEVGKIKQDEKYIFNGPFKIGYFGQLEKNKGVGYLIKAILEIPSTIVSSVFICGDGSVKQELQELSKKDKRIRFFGKLPRQEIYKKMGDVDLTFVPSMWDEPFGRVIIESYRQGTPVYASNVGGIPEVIINEDFLFQASSVTEIKRVIMEFSKKSNVERKIISNECLAYSEKFDVGNNAIKHLEIYNKLI